MQGLARRNVDLDGLLVRPPHRIGIGHVSLGAVVAVRIDAELVYSGRRHSTGVTTVVKAFAADFMRPAHRIPTSSRYRTVISDRSAMDGLRVAEKSIVLLKANRQITIPVADQNDP